MEQSHITDVSGLIADIVERVRTVSGVEAIVLGGSRARGTQTPTSDVDLGIYYDRARPLDIAALARVAADIDDQHRPDAVTPIGEWGPWINGGGWLTCQNIPVDFLYRDLDQVSTVINRCLIGEFTHVYQPGHPHGFPSYIYMAEIALCQPLWDPHNKIAALKANTVVYPPLLQQAIIKRFFWEADFSLKVARKGVSRGDVSYVAGCCFRAVVCLTQTLFALNEQYWMNEKGAVALAATFSRHPEQFAERITGAFGQLSADPREADSAIDRLETLAHETGILLDSI